MIIGSLRIQLLLPGCRSLKSKRQIKNSIRDKTRSRFNVSVAEVGHQELWQRTALGFAAIGSSRKVVESTLSKIENMVENMGKGELLDVQLEFF